MGRPSNRAGARRALRGHRGAAPARALRGPARRDPLSDALPAGPRPPPRHLRGRGRRGDRRPRPDAFAGGAAGPRQGGGVRRRDRRPDLAHGDHRARARRAAGGGPAGRGPAGGAADAGHRRRRPGRRGRRAERRADRRLPARGAPAQGARQRSRRLPRAALREPGRRADLRCWRISSCSRRSPRPSGTAPRASGSTAASFSTSSAARSCPTRRSISPSTGGCSRR